MKKNIIKVLLAASLFLFVFNFTLSIVPESSMPLSLDLVMTKSSAISENQAWSCSLSSGQFISGTYCVVVNVLGPAGYLWSFNTATCNSICDAGGLNCCYHLLGDI